jgi:hypothetical protein
MNALKGKYLSYVEFRRQYEQLDSIDDKIALKPELMRLKEEWMKAFSGTGKSVQTKTLDIVSKYLDEEKAAFDNTPFANPQASNYS